MESERFVVADAEILVGGDAQETFRIAAGQFAALARKASAEGRGLYVALSGGSTPRALFEILAQNPFRDIVPWTAVHCYWGDERNVPPDHPDSNFRMAEQALLSHVPIPRANIHRVPTGEGVSAEQAASAYEQVLNETVPKANGIPRFDLMLLGLGTNGHTASLFPHCPAVHETAKHVTADYVEEVKSWRITLTAPVINNSAQITFLATGQEKAPVVAEIVSGARDIDRLPAQLIHASSGVLTWILDHAAAASLERTTQGESAS